MVGVWVLRFLLAFLHGSHSAFIITIIFMILQL